MDWLKKENPICFKTYITEKLSRGLFYITFILYLAFMTASDTSLRYVNSSYLVIIRYGMWICFGLAFLNVIFLCWYTVGQLLCIFAFVALYIIIWYQTNGSEYTYLQGMMIVFSCYHITWNHLLRFTFATYIPLIIVPALLEVFGILPTLEVFRGDQQRLSLGFSHPNALGGYCLCFIILWLLIRYKYLKIGDYIAWIAMALFVWLIPNSRTSTFLILLLILLTVISKHWGERIIQSRIIRVLCSGVYALMAIASILVSYLYDANNALFVKIDQDMFTTRISCASSFLQNYSIKLFGQKLTLVGSVRAKMTGTEPQILDNFYVHQLLSTGIVSFLIIIAVFTYLSYSAVKKRDMAVLIGLLIMAVCFVYENHGTELNYNFMLFYIMYRIVERGESPNDQNISDSTCL